MPESPDLSLMIEDYIEMCCGPVHFDAKIMVDVWADIKAEVERLQEIAWKYEGLVK